MGPIVEEIVVQMTLDGETGGDLRGVDLGDGGNFSVVLRLRLIV